jgi:hypothetical protein
VSQAKSSEFCVILYLVLSVLIKVIKYYNCGVPDRYYLALFGTWIGMHYYLHASLNYREQDLPEPFIQGKH